MDQAKPMFQLFQPRYFEIPTKDTPLQESPVQERPTKECLTGESPTKERPTRKSSTETPAIVQSHASFTIEFDDMTPGKIKIKDQVTKFSTRTQRRPTETEVMSVQSKVADWLVHGDISVMRRRPTSDDVYSTKSDHAVKTRILRGMASTGFRTGFD